MLPSSPCPSSPQTFSPDGQRQMLRRTFFTSLAPSNAYGDSLRTSGCKKSKTRRNRRKKKRASCVLLPDSHYGAGNIHTESAAPIGQEIDSSGATDAARRRRFKRESGAQAGLSMSRRMCGDEGEQSSVQIRTGRASSGGGELSDERRVSIVSTLIELFQQVINITN